MKTVQQAIAKLLLPYDKVEGLCKEVEASRSEAEHILIKYIQDIDKQINYELCHIAEAMKEIANRNNDTLLKNNPDTEIYNMYGYFLGVLQNIQKGLY